MKRVVIGLFFAGVGLCGFAGDGLAQSCGRPWSTPVYYTPCRSYYPQSPACAAPPSPPVSLIYRVEERRVWVPGYWACIYDPCGRERKVWQPPGWQIQQVRVPVRNSVAWSGGPIRKFTW